MQAVGEGSQEKTFKLMLILCFMTPETSLLYLKYFFIFAIGVILGRITMAIQYAVMKGEQKWWKFWK